MHDLPLFLCEHYLHYFSQENTYWSMSMNPYKFGFSGPEYTYYYGQCEVNDHLPRVDAGWRTWEYGSTMNTDEPKTTDTQSEGEALMNVHATPEEC